MMTLFIASVALLFGDRFGRAFFQEGFDDRGRGLRHRGSPGIGPRGG